MLKYVNCAKKSADFLRGSRQWTSLIDVIERLAVIRYSFYLIYATYWQELLFWVCLL